MCVFALVNTHILSLCFSHIHKHVQMSKGKDRERNKSVCASIVFAKGSEWIPERVLIDISNVILCAITIGTGGKLGIKPLEAEVKCNFICLCTTPYLNLFRHCKRRGAFNPSLQLVQLQIN